MLPTSSMRSLVHTDPSSLSASLRARRCRIFSFDPYAEVPGMVRRPLPAAWDRHHDSTASWVSAALRASPWRTSDLSEAEVVYFDVDWSSLCQPSPTRTNWTIIPHVWAGGLAALARLLAPATAPKAVILQQQACVAPWQRGGGGMPAGVLALHEYISLRNAREARTSGYTRHAVSPFAISTPAWLAGAEPAPPTLRVAWARRKLLLFAGHVPKLTISRHRYDLWRQLRGKEGVSTHSHSINCTIGQFVGCARGRAWLEAQPNAFFYDDCQRYCPRVHHLGHAGKACNGGADGASARSTGGALSAGPSPSVGAPVSAGGGVSRSSTSAPCIEPCVGSRRFSVAQNRARFARKCAAHSGVDFASEAADYLRDSRERWSFDRYLLEAMRHRFCLVAMGDRLGTPKITEMVNVGGSGGCIPVVVLLRGATPQDALRVLPYARWLDWCSIAFFAAQQRAAAGGVDAVLRKLRAVTPAQARRKHEALAAAREAFAMRRRASPTAGASPSAAEYLLGEICDLGRSYRAALLSGPTNLSERAAPLGHAHSIEAPVAGDLSHCMLI